MNINILIPSKNNSTKLKENIEKNFFADSINLQYLILVDTLEDEILYRKTLSKFKNVKIIKKKLNFQSDRYIHLLNYKDADLYLIGSDDLVRVTSQFIERFLTIPTA